MPAVLTVRGGSTVTLQFHAMVGSARWYEGDDVSMEHVGVRPAQLSSWIVRRAHIGVGMASTSVSNPRDVTASHANKAKCLSRGHAVTMDAMSASPTEGDCSMRRSCNSVSDGMLRSGCDISAGHGPMRGVTRCSDSAETAAMPARCTYFRRGAHVTSASKPTRHV